MTMLETIQRFALNTQYSTVKKNFVQNLYRTLRNHGIACVMVNDLYLEVDGVEYQFIHRKKDGIYEAQAIVSRYNF